MGPRAGLDDVEKRKFVTLLGLELRPLCHPAPSQSLYRLRYPDSYVSGYYPLQDGDLFNTEGGGIHSYHCPLRS
jgi:hypothetical protein